ncbi:MAG: winged helix-turn-helix domain-containing protein, partial [Planctomycetota bacterium]|nr:winged helix-turn-helix domain-containing protein [Planctomycetota bacterium]
MTSIDLMPSEAIYKQIKTWIINGDLAPGKILPSERQLAGQMNATRNAVRNALARLEEEGLIEHRSKRLRIVRALQADGDLRPAARQPIILEKTIGLFAAPNFQYVAQAKKEGGWEHNIYYGVFD